jgi:hypothetical protein
MNHLNHLFLAETSINPVNSQGEPDVDYVKWLEEKLEKQIEFTRFSKSDWMSYSGAEKLSDGSDPFIGEIEVTMYNGETLKGDIIVTQEGIDICLGGININTDDLFLQRQPSCGSVLLILERKTTEEQLKNLGFIKYS